MWKDALLQVMIALIPVFAFQMWFDRSNRSKSIPMFLGVVSCISMILCMIMTTETASGAELDFRMIPFIIGALYGGIPVAAGLTIVYVSARVNIIDGFWEQLGLAAFLFLFIPILLFITNRFQAANRRRKQRIAVGLGLLMLAVFHATYIGAVEWKNIHLYELLGFILFSSVLFSFVIWAAVFIIESVKEKQQLQHQLQRMSMNYRNEVQKLQQFIDITPLSVVIVDRRGSITHLNEKAFHLIGDEQEGADRLAWIGKPFTQLYSMTRDGPSLELMYGALNGNDMAAEIIEQHNKTFILSSFSVRDIHNNGIIGAAIVAHDITELSRLRDEIGRMERLSLVGQMAASITHEIRNPMAVIRGFVQLMQERSPDHQREYFRIIIEELDRANGIINDFLSLAQNRIINKEQNSLNTIITELMPLLQADANLRGQTIEVQLEENLPKLLLNEKEMKQLILNLARNGMEAMSEKGLLIIRTQQLAHGVELSVTDRGIGIPAEKLERLFEPFYTTKTRGTGLGLPLCLSIVERHNGKIEVHSVESEGTTFAVLFDYS